MTLRLETLGGLSLTDADGKGRLVQRRRLAVLALLATADERGLSRDRLVAYLWPESTEESARHSLEQLLYELRRSIADDLFLGVNPVRLNPAVIESDAAIFEHALATGAAADAVALYRGPFLDGFYLNDAPEFERWATVERSRLAGRYMDALDQLAGAAEAEGVFGVAVDWRRKLAALDPLSAPRALALMRALASAGDSAAALSHARTYESLVRLELDAAPDSSIAAYARRLREGTAPESAPTGLTDAVAAPPPTDTTPTKRAPPLGASAPGPNDSSSAPAVAPTADPVRATRLKRAMVLAGLSTTLVLVSMWVLRLAGVFRRDGPVLDDRRVAVLPARVVGSDSTIPNVAEGVMDLLAAALTGDGVLAAVDPRATISAWRRANASSDNAFTVENARRVARDVHAGTALLTEVAWLGAGQLKLTARFLTVSDGLERAHAEQRGPADSLINLVDRLLAELLLRESGEEHLRLATLTTQSLTALGAFLKGRAEHRRGHREAAIAHFARALTFDSTFALAALELAIAHGWTLRWTTRASDTVAQTMPIGAGARQAPTTAARTLWDDAMHIAWTERDRLSVRDRAVLGAVAGPRFPGASNAREFLAAWDEAVRAAPDRADVLFTLGELLLYHGATLGLAEPLARAGASFNRALEYDSAFVAPLAGLIELAAFDLNARELRRLGTLYFVRDSLGAQADYLRWRIATVTGDVAVLRALRAKFTSLDPETLERIQTTSQVAGIAVEDAVRASDAILGRASEGAQRQIALHNAFWLALNRGRPAQALAILAQKRDLDPNDDLRLAHTLRGALFGDGDLAAGEESARTLEKRIGWPPRTPAGAQFSTQRVMQGTFSIALWRLWHGDTTGAVDAIVRLRSDSARGTAQPELLDALLAELTDRPDRALALQRLDSIAMLGCCTLPHFINFGSARLHERAGDLRGALAAIRRGRWLFPPEYLAVYLREEGRLADLTGDREGAIRAYRHYLALRSDPEAVLRPAVDSVRHVLVTLERSR